MGYVFISYSTKEQSLANAMKKLLEKQGIQTWMAPGDIPVGNKYARVINQAIKDCSCFILMLSNNSQNSVWVAKEVERAVNYRKPILPIQIEDVVLNDEFELYISTNQVIAINNINENSDKIKQVLLSVETFINNSNSEKDEVTNNIMKQKGIYCNYNVDKNNDSRNIDETSCFLNTDNLLNLVTTKTLSEIDIEEMRSQSNIAKSLSVPIGKDLDGNTVMLDLSCKKDGSNGIIFGPEGSGNEQFIYTYFILLSLFFSPADIQLHMVDLWNDNRTKAMQRLPHSGGYLIQGNSDSVEKFIDMFRQEETKRKKLFAQYNVSNIYQYLSLRELNENSMPPLPHIIIGIKEIGYFKPEHPDAFEELNQFARKADILGIHCLYSTQFFDGIVDESVYNNADFKLCSVSQHDLLDSDSMQEVIPDRFYFQSQLRDSICEIQLARFLRRTTNSDQENNDKTNSANWFLNQSQDVSISLINAIARYDL